MEEVQENSNSKAVIFFIFVAMVLVAFFSWVLFVSVLRANSCGDGTFYGKCSDNKPYFCEKGVLVERASVCGCTKFMEEKNESCISGYELNGTERNFDYGGGEINFLVYEGFNKYMKSLPKGIRSNGQEISKQDFKLKEISEPLQEKMLLPLVVKIQNLARDPDEQAKIATRLVQNIPYNASEQKDFFSGLGVNYSRSIYEVLYDDEGICGERSNLLSFLLKELGFGTAIFYYNGENHEAVGIECPFYKDYKRTGYCFIETTAPYEIGEYKFLTASNILSKPEVIKISEGRKY